MKLDKIIEELEKLDERMYNVNATISGRYVTGLYKITEREIRLINGNIAEWIKKVRELKEQLEAQND